MRDHTWTLQQIVDLGYTPIGWLTCSSCHSYFYIVHKSGAVDEPDEHLLLRTTPTDLFGHLSDKEPHTRFVEPQRPSCPRHLRALANNQR